MKYFVSFAVLSMICCATQAANVSRPAMSSKMMAAPRHTASVNQLNGLGAVSSNTIVTTTTTSEEDNREAERNACINNNIGVEHAAFVWASRYSDTSSYASMVEDTVNPKNNVCFVRVEVKSDDSRISVSDIPAKYFMWGETIECGSWVNQKDMEKRILNAKKGARVGGVVASTVGGAGLGVGAMELFGNKLINGAVEGQKAKDLEKDGGAQLYIAQIETLKKTDSSKYNELVDALKTIKNSDDSIRNDEPYKSLIDKFVK